jgi:hypothetical protein
MESSFGIVCSPTILKALGLDPNQLDAVRAEGTAVLPEVAAQLEK